MSDRPRIVVVGSANVDFVVRSRRLPRSGETVTGGRFLTSPGGKGANQAVAAARLGADVTFVARLGADAIGDEAVAGYEREGIRTDYVVRDTERATGVALILVDERGGNLISVAPGANDGLTRDDVEDAAERIRSADALLLQLEVSLEVVLRASELAFDACVPVILDPAPAPDGPLPVELLRRVSYLTPNEVEAERLSGESISSVTQARSIAESLRAQGSRYVLITRGDAGVVVSTPDRTFSTSPFRVDAVDSTAAGDAFNAALACALAAGQGLEDSIREASLAGALAAIRPGAQASLPTRAELNAFRRVARPVI